MQILRKSSSHLRQDVVHGLARLHVVLAEHAQQAYEAHLQERVADARHVVVRTVAGQDEVLEDAHQVGHELKV